MKTANAILFISFFLFSAILALAQPTPPNGKKWEKIESMSDEFNGSSLNTSKWSDQDPQWEGRPPARFEKSAVKVGGGHLQITASKKSNPNGRWTHDGGLVRSKIKNTYGYYEVRMKANKTFMSSTFWLINKRNEFQGCDFRTTELDVTENIGVNTGGQSWINRNMVTINSNTHSRGARCNSTPQGIRGDKSDIGEPAYAGYHTYGVWWKGPKELLFYLDGKFVHKITPVANFNLAMYLRMVVETYDWNPPKGGKDGMNDSKVNRTTYYDWIRSYKLVNCNTNCDNNGGGNDSISFKNPALSIPSKKSYTFSLDYKAYTNREIVVEFWSSTSWMAQSKKTVQKGSGTTSITVDLPQAPAPGSGYIYKTHIRPIGTSWQQAIDRDQVDNVSVTRETSQLIENGVYFMKSEKLGQNILSRAIEKHSARLHNAGNWDDQKWVFKHLGNNIYTIQNLGNKRFLEVPYAQCNNGSDVATWMVATQNHQKWKVVSLNSTSYALQPVHCNTKALDVSGGAKNANVQIWDFNANNSNQRWILEKTSTSRIGLTPEKISSISVYPNPVIDHFKITGVAEGEILKITDISGKTVKDISIKSKEESIDISTLSKGIYFIKGVGKECVKLIKN